MKDWNELENSIKDCEKCNLCKNRKHIVLGEGNKNADIMLIGEGPGADEDEEGIPFVGKAGKLMDEAFCGTGIKRENLYIANIVKCRPPQNRDSEKEEADACMPYLKAQIELVKPKIIVLLGRIALTNILGEDMSITRERGNLIERNGITYLPTWHPAALLRDDTKKIQFWQDLKKLEEIAKEKGYTI